MLRKTKPIKRRNSSKDSKDEDRKRQLEQFLNQGKVKKLEYQIPESRMLRKGDLKHDHRCSYCDGWENEDGEFQHYEYCPKYKGRRNPITSSFTNKFTPIVDLDIGKTSKSNVVINYENKEIVFTGKDAEEIRDIIKYQLKNFRESSKLQKRYPGNQLNGGGFYLYLTEILRDIYPRYFK